MLGRLYEPLHCSEVGTEPGVWWWLSEATGAAPSGHVCAGGAAGAGGARAPWLQFHRKVPILEYPCAPQPGGCLLISMPGMSGQRLPGELSLLGGSWGGWEEASVGEFDVVRELPLLSGCKEQSTGLPLLLGEAGDAEQDPELPCGAAAVRCWAEHSEQVTRLS